MTASVSSTQEYGIAPKLENYKSHQAWFHDLTDWFIQVGLKVNRLEPKLEAKAEQPAKIRRWTSTTPMKFKVFRKQQARLIKSGHSPVIYGSYKVACPVCACSERISIGMKRGKEFAADYDICLQCWSVVESFPVYE